MDLDAFAREFATFKRRIEPMLAEYEAEVARRNEGQPVKPDAAAESAKPAEGQGEPAQSTAPADPNAPAASPPNPAGA